MSDEIRFETPENVQISYRPAGLGTRFLAWTIDQVFVTILLIVAFVVMAFFLASVDGAGESIEDAVESFDPVDSNGQLDMGPYAMVFVGLFLLAYGLGSFVYFGFSELLLRGQTFGKRSAKIRVVKADGFSLDASSVFLRNLFRVADQIPPLWVVPAFSARSQRFGDMVSGTLVVADGDAGLPPLRAALSERSATDAVYRFDATALKKLRAQDTLAIEALLERWTDLPRERRQAMVTAIVPAIATRLGVEPPRTDSEEAPRRFLEDLLAAEYRRRSRKLTS
ncbi:RDD family protein [Botrimarina mediterranea]|uniref:RDD family protein n=1 Tax=Botrimarina mediterranea TaxID=2528022 RepID=A0A518K2C3_9BACT|nr:RDD family protein [Botrimarina mediterranea]QDV71954.1 RDD family protein [Botrimarina mediterranea]QDV76495.1 RDD family protein [Planctomycetes bacterium K2D]